MTEQPEVIDNSDDGEPISDTTRFLMAQAGTLRPFVVEMQRARPIIQQGIIPFDNSDNERRLDGLEAVTSEIGTDKVAVWADNADVNGAAVFIGVYSPDDSFTQDVIRGFSYASSVTVSSNDNYRIFLRVAVGRDLTNTRVMIDYPATDDDEVVGASGWTLQFSDNSFAYYQRIHPDAGGREFSGLNLGAVILTQVTATVRHYRWDGELNNLSMFAAISEAVSGDRDTREYVAPTENGLVYRRLPDIAPGAGLGVFRGIFDRPSRAGDYVTYLTETVAGERNNDIAAIYSDIDFLVSYYRYEGDTWVFLYDESLLVPAAWAVINNGEGIPFFKMRPFLFDSDVLTPISGAAATINFDVNNVPGGETIASTGTFTVTETQVAEPNAQIRIDYDMTDASRSGQPPTEVELILRMTGDGRIIDRQPLQDYRASHLTFDVSAETAAITLRWAIRVATKGRYHGSVAISNVNFHADDGSADPFIRRVASELVNAEVERTRGRLLPENPTIGDFAKWDGSNWVASAAPSGGASPEMIGLQDVSIGANANTVNVLVNTSVSSVGTLVLALSAGGGRPGSGIRLKAGSYLLTFMGDVDATGERFNPQFSVTGPRVGGDTAPVYFRGTTGEDSAVWHMSLVLPSDSDLTFSARQGQYSTQVGGIGGAGTVSDLRLLIQPLGMM